MANNFVGDDSCKALWKYNSGALTVDSSGNGNTLSVYGAPAESTGVGGFKEGGCAVSLAVSNDDGFHIADGDLSLDFPFKYGDTKKKIAICSWFKLAAVAHGQHADIITKLYTSDPAGYESFRLSCYQWDSQYRLYLTIGRAEDPGYQSLLMFTHNYIGVWMHIGATYDDSTKAATGRLWNSNTSTAYSYSGATDYNARLCEASLGIGCTHWGTAHTVDWEGLIDEEVVFNRILSETEIDKIRSGRKSVV